MRTPIDGRPHVAPVGEYPDGSVAASDPTGLDRAIAETFPAVMDETAGRWSAAQFEYPDDGYHEVYLRSDKALLRCRKILEEMEQKNRLQAPPAPAPAQKVA
jgi:vanillate O-demethylase monooxygenase subunit